MEGIRSAATRRRQVPWRACDLRRRRGTTARSPWRKARSGRRAPRVASSTCRGAAPPAQARARRIHEEPRGRGCPRPPRARRRGAWLCGGQWTLAAARRRALRVREQALGEINARKAWAVYNALRPYQPVEVGEAVARAKIVPLPSREGTGQASGGSRVAAVVWSRSGFRRTESEPDPGESARAATGTLRSGLDGESELVGSSLLPSEYCPDDGHAVARALESLAGAGAELLVAAGAASLDPLTRFSKASRMAGGDMVRHGTPAHPGSLLWLARVEGSPRARAACGMFSQRPRSTGPPRLLTGEDVANAELAGMGHGGCCPARARWRFPPIARAQRARATRVGHGLQRCHSPALQEPALSGQPAAPDTLRGRQPAVRGSTASTADRRWSTDDARTGATAAPSAPPPPISWSSSSWKSPWRSGPPYPVSRCSNGWGPTSAPRA